MIYIGVDPSQIKHKASTYGGVCFINETEIVSLIRFDKDPLEVSSNILSLLDDFKNNSQTISNIYVEHIWSLNCNMRASQANFNMGGGWALLNLGLSAHFPEIDPVYVVPRVWQSHFIPKDVKFTKGSKGYAERKKYLWDVAKKLYPDTKIVKSMADAVLIAHYNKLKSNPKK